MEVDGGAGDGVSVSVAVVACTAMTIFYVAILYSPTLILRLPPPTSFKSYMTRRFICAGISTFVSLLVCAFILPVSWNFHYPLSSANFDSCNGHWQNQRWVLEQWTFRTSNCFLSWQLQNLRKKNSITSYIAILCFLALHTARL